MATRNGAVFRGVFEKVEDRAHNRTRLVSRLDSGTRALLRPCEGCTCGATCPSLNDCRAARLARIEIGHFERSLFRAREPQPQATFEEMCFGLWLANIRTGNPSVGRATEKELEHWRQFTRTRIYGPTVEVIE